MIKLNHLLILLLSTFSLVNTGCQRSDKDKTFVVIDPSGEIVEKARNAGFMVSGENIIEISGPPKEVSDMLESESLNYMADESLELRTTEATELEELPMYLAKRDFKLDEFLKDNPNSDGRGVIVGVIDDGISANQIGFVKTTTGQRKIIKRESNSSDLLLNSKKLISQNWLEL